MKSSSKTPIFAAAALLIGAGVLVWKGMKPSSESSKVRVADERTASSGNSHRPRSASAGMAAVEGGEAAEILPVSGVSPRAVTFFEFSYSSIVIF